MAGVVLSILAHPDDAEFLCAGTLIRLVREHGWMAHFATMTPGDCGSVEHRPDEIAALRREEGKLAAQRIGGVYHCLEERDLQVFYNERTLEKVTRLIREVRPNVLLTHSPADYMLDHEMTSQVVRAASFAAPIPNFLPNRLPRATAHLTHLYYCDPIEGKDALGQPIDPGFCLDITSVMETKAEMLTCHASQRDWLRKHHGMDQYLQAMRDWGQERGRRLGTAFAEGFRQHRGHSYPQDNLLAHLLG